MAKNWKKNGGSDEINFWPAFADMAAATCMMLAIFWLAGTWELSGSEDEVAKLRREVARLKELAGKDVKLVEENLRRQSIIDGQKIAIKELNNRAEIADLARIKAEKARDKADLARIKAEKALAQLRHTIPSDEPPNIVLTDGESFIFPSLQAALPPGFKQRFENKMRQSVINAINSKSNVEVIEIIGHTDKDSVRGRSNFDKNDNIESVFNRKKLVSGLEFGSNCELGLARAIAVKSMLEDFLKTIASDPESGLTPDGRGRISRLTFRTYSAAQLFPVNRLMQIAPKDGSGIDEDRRIEIRFTRLRDEAKP